MNRRAIKKALHRLEIVLYLMVPAGAGVLVLLTTVFNISPNATLQLLIVLVAGLAVSESLGRFGTLNDIAENTKELTERSNLELLRGANDSGVVGIFLRQDPTRVPDLVRAIERCRGPLDLCGIALPGLIEDKRIRDAVIAHSQRDDVRVLLLKPDCEEAARRAEIEMSMGRRTILDIETTLDWLMRQQIVNKRFRVHRYNLPPMLSLMITDRCVYVEPYHFGKPDGVEGCIGGHVPMMKIKNLTESESPGNPYEFFKAHFDYLWGITQGLRAHLPIEIVSSRPSAFVVLGNRSPYDIRMEGWKLSAQGGSTAYEFKPDLVWRKKTEIAIYCGSEKPEETNGLETTLPADEGFLGNNSILTLMNGVGTVMVELAPQGTRQLAASA